MSHISSSTSCVVERLLPALRDHLWGPMAYPSSPATHSSHPIVDSAAVQASYARWRHCFGVWRKVLGNDIILLSLLLHSGCIWGPNYDRLFWNRRRTPPHPPPPPTTTRTATTTKTVAQASPEGKRKPEVRIGAAGAHRAARRGLSQKTKEAKWKHRVNGRDQRQGSEEEMDTARDYLRFADEEPYSIFALNVLHFLNLVEVFRAPEFLREAEGDPTAASFASSRDAGDVESCGSEEERRASFPITATSLAKKELEAGDCDSAKAAPSMPGDFSLATRAGGRNALERKQLRRKFSTDAHVKRRRLPKASPARTKNDNASASSHAWGSLGGATGGGGAHARAFTTGTSEPLDEAEAENLTVSEQLFGVNKRLVTALSAHDTLSSTTGRATLLSSPISPRQSFLQKAASVASGFASEDGSLPVASGPAPVMLDERDYQRLWMAAVTVDDEDEPLVQRVGAWLVEEWFALMRWDSLDASSPHVLYALRAYWLASALKLSAYVDGTHTALLDENEHAQSVLLRQAMPPQSTTELFHSALPSILLCFLVEEVAAGAFVGANGNEPSYALFLPPPVYLLPFHNLGSGSRGRVGGAEVVVEAGVQWEAANGLCLPLRRLAPPRRMGGSDKAKGTAYLWEASREASGDHLRIDSCASRILLMRPISEKVVQGGDDDDKTVRLTPKSLEKGGEDAKEKGGGARRGPRGSGRRRPPLRAEQPLTLLYGEDRGGAVSAVVAQRLGVGITPQKRASPSSSRSLLSGRAALARDSLATVLQMLFLSAKRILALRGSFVGTEPAATRQGGRTPLPGKGGAAAGSGKGPASTMGVRGTPGKDGLRYTTPTRKALFFPSAATEQAALFEAATSLTLTSLFLAHNLGDALLEQLPCALWTLEEASLIADLCVETTRPMPRLLKAAGYALCLVPNQPQSLLVAVGLFATLGTREMHCLQGNLETDPATLDEEGEEGSRSPHSKAAPHQLWWTLFSAEVLRDASVPAQLHPGVWALSESVNRSIQDVIEDAQRRRRATASGRAGLALSRTRVDRLEGAVRCLQLNKAPPASSADPAVSQKLPLPSRGQRRRLSLKETPIAGGAVETTSGLCDPPGEASPLPSDEEEPEREKPLPGLCGPAVVRVSLPPIPEVIPDASAQELAMPLMPGSCRSSLRRGGWLEKAVTALWVSLESSVRAFKRPRGEPVHYGD